MAAPAYRPFEVPQRRPIALLERDRYFIRYYPHRFTRDLSEEDNWANVGLKTSTLELNQDQLYGLVHALYMCLGRSTDELLDNKVVITGATGALNLEHMIETSPHLIYHEQVSWERDTTTIPNPLGRAEAQTLAQAWGKELLWPYTVVLHNMANSTEQVVQFNGPDFMQGYLTGCYALSSLYNCYRDLTDGTSYYAV